MDIQILDYFGHLGYIFIATGILFLAKKRISGWILRGVGELIWVGIGIGLGMSSVWIWSTLFLFLEAHGFYSWRKEKKSAEEPEKPRELLPMWRKEGTDYVVGFMDLIDFQMEVGGAMDGTKIYPSVEDLRRERLCTEGCGIIEVEIRGRQIIQPYRD